jgi:ribosomal 50S subunit-associated protein YjgA (DUF615 family)
MTVEPSQIKADAKKRELKTPLDNQIAQQAGRAQPTLVTGWEVALERFAGARQHFHEIEAELLAVIDELRANDSARMRNLARLEGLRVQLVTFFDEAYRQAADLLADAAIGRLTSNVEDASEPARPL